MDDVVHVRVCTMCDNSLNRGVTPSRAVANGHLLGELPPKLRDFAMVEEAMIARRRAKVWVLHLQDTSSSDSTTVFQPSSHGARASGTQRGVKGLVIVFPAKPEKLGRLLPSSTGSIVICNNENNTGRPGGWIGTDAMARIFQH